MKQTLYFALCVSLSFFIGCQKHDLSANRSGLDNKVITQKFFTPTTSLNQKDASILNFLKNENAKKEFVIETVSKIGYPRWDKMITEAKKNNTRANSFGGEEDTVTTILPFVQEEDTTVKACLVINSTIDDTSYYYLCDWQYSLVAETDANTYNQEKFATFFMMLNKEVFDYTVFNITDSSLFSMYPKNVVRIKLEDSSTTNLYEICETVTIYFENCTYQDTEECSNGCDQCWLCMESISWEYCTTVNSGGGGGAPGNPGGTTGGGGGTGNGGGTTPPPCPGSVAQTNGCGPGWVPNTTMNGPFHEEGLEQHEVPFETWETQTFPPQNLPSWNVFDSVYTKDSLGCEMEAPLVYQMAGGPLYNSHLADPFNYGNACALRISIALVKSGITIPYIRASNGNGTYRDVTRLGANGKYYFITASDLYNWMKPTFGMPPPSHVVLPSEVTDGDFGGKLPNDSGIYIMRANSRTAFGATGHASLFINGNPPCNGHLFPTNSDVGGGIKDVTLWKLN